MRSLHSCLGTARHSCRSSWTARLASFTFRPMERSLPTSVSFTSCWVSVDPPWATPPASVLARNARSTDRALTPL